MKTVIVYHPKFPLHLTGIGHPECPERYSVIIAKLQADGLMDAENSLLAVEAPLEAVQRCHPLHYIELVKRECEQVKELNVPGGSRFLSTGDAKISACTYEVALLAAGAGLIAVDAVMQKKAHNAFCAIRPPGHHATTNQGMGFCLFNNVAIAARYVQAAYGLKRVLIVDWDVHHGNGTEEIFYVDPSVFYFSTHQAGIYPGTGKREDVGTGNICNRPIPSGKYAKVEIFKAYQVDLLQAMKDFKPEFILISAGFDAHQEDPLGGFDLQTEDFAELTRIVAEIAQTYCEGRLVSFLEGGYNLHALQDSVSAHVKALQEIKKIYVN